MTTPPDSWLAENGVLVTALLVLMFLACVGYTVYVMVLDIRETRAEAESDAARWGTIDGTDPYTGSTE